MLFILTLLSLVSISVWVYISWMRVKQYWQIRNVPFVPPNPIFGSLTFLLKHNPASWFRSYYSKSPYVGIWLFWRPGIIVNSYDLALKIMINDFESFRDRFLGSVTKVPLSNNLFLAKDPIWSSVRRRLTTVFTSAKLKAFQSLISNKGHELSLRINNDIKNQTRIELKNLFVDFTTDVISTISFGVESEAMLTGKGHMREITSEFSQFSIYEGVAWCSIFFLPELADLLRVDFFPSSAINYLRKVFQSVVAQRGGYKADKTQIKDLLDALVKMKQEASNYGEEMDEDLLIAQAAVFLVGGYDTTAMSLTYCVYELAFAAPHIQDKLYNEVVQTKESFGNKDIDIATLSGLTYLNCVIQESLRKYPGMGWLDRVSTKTYKIDETLTIPAGTPVYINLFGMQYDPQYYTEPEKFDPDRFLPHNDVSEKPFLAFGHGPRHCIGQRLALQSLRYALASIVLNFKLLPLPNTPKPSECIFEKKYLLIQPGNSMCVNFVPRNHNTVTRL